ncbi:MAG: ATP-binding protein [Alphaproteobacteria bacterium]
MASAAPDRATSLAARLGRWADRVRLSRKLAPALAIGALASGLLTYGALSGAGPFEPAPDTVLVLLLVDLVLLLLLAAVVLRGLVRLWIERRRGSAGSRLHVHLVALFSLVAIVPTILVALFSALPFNLGLDAWFSERVRTAVGESVAVAEAYLAEHRQNIRADAFAMANDINRFAPTLFDNPALFNPFLKTQAALRELTEAMVFRRDGRILARTGLPFVLAFEPVPLDALEQAATGKVVILTSDDDRVRALIRLEGLIDGYLFVGRFVDSRVLAHMARAQRAAREYSTLKDKRADIQITFAMIFVVVALLLLFAAAWVGLTFATQLVRPISGLVAAAERIRAGDLGTRVPEGPDDDEIGTLSRAFNRMTDQLESRRRELIKANRQLDTRRRFTESVLSGVSAGVIGLDPEGRIDLPNRSALTLLSSRPEWLVGRKLSEAVPEMAGLSGEALARPQGIVEGQITLKREGRTRTLLVRISAGGPPGEVEGFVVTFDDVTALLAAQRTAAWADVARRIAHEIKNPLTPIQLSAERLKRKFVKEIKSDPEVFTTCTETIIRQVGDIGRMIDEFSTFAQMPAPVFDDEDVLELARQAILMQEIAHPEVTFARDFPNRSVRLECDGRQVVQALTNLLRNAVEAIESREAPPRKSLPPGRVRVRVEEARGRCIIEVHDNGRGLPVDQRERLVEPYVTTRAKGTGLGLAIVKRIMEDHGARLELADGADGGACVRLIFLSGEARKARGPARAAAREEKVASHGA